MSLIFLIDAFLCLFFLCGFLSLFWFHRKIKSLSKSRKEFQNLFDTVSHALEKGRQNLTNLQEMNAQLAEEAHKKIEAASALAEDLRFFIDRGEGLMEHLETHVRAAREIKQDFEKLIQTYSSRETVQTERGEPIEITEPLTPLTLKRLRANKQSKGSIFFKREPSL